MWLPSMKKGTKKNMENYTIFKMHLAGYLMQRGFVLVDIGINRYNPDKRVFYFKDSQELQAAIKAYSQMQN